ncbi:MAG: hypothetical protein GC187_07485 [Alphaproteobacteria bacterium]|nr:hypothetical protein [Alphaproteobacteria bacterium]
MTQNDYWPDFQRDGEEATRKKVSAGVYAGNRLAQAEAWLQHAELEAKKSSNYESLRIARSAKNAAWAAAIAAIIAVPIAIAAMVISYLSYLASAP